MTKLTLAVSNLLLSYTGDLHGRWDSCNIHLFRDAASSTLRILAVKEGVEESFDQQFGEWVMSKKQAEKIHPSFPGTNVVHTAKSRLKKRNLFRNTGIIDTNPSSIFAEVKTGRK